MPWEFVLPAGLDCDVAPDTTLEERYEVQWRDDDDPAHYFFWAQVSALRIERVVGECFALLPPEVHVVLEVRLPAADGGDGDDAPTHERWASPAVPREKLLAVWTAHGTALVHDGMVGFGAYDPASSLEVFLDDHKLLNCFAPALDPFEGLMRRNGIPEGRTFPTILDADHDHVPLVELPSRGRCRKRAWPRRRRNDVTWFAPAIRKALRMRRQDPRESED